MVDLLVYEHNMLEKKMLSRNLIFLLRVVKQRYTLKKTDIPYARQITNLTSKCFKVSILTVFCQTSLEKPINNEQLTHEFLVKQSAVQVADSFTSLLDKVTCALLDTYTEYGNVLEEILFLHNERQSYIGNTFLEDQVWEKLIPIKSSLEDLKKKTGHLEFQITSVTNLANATAEVSFGCGAEYAAITTNERLISALQQLKLKRDGIEKLEKELIEIETKLVEVTVKEYEKQTMVDNEQESFTN